MSFYFDDDNDDNAFSQQSFSFQTSSQQKQVTFSQTTSSTLPFSQFSNVSPQKQFSSPQQPLFVSPSQLSQKSLPTTKRESNNNNNKAHKAFVCQNCGAVDDYYLDSGGLVTCSNCFTQSQSHVMQEELDYEESQHMAARNRDGTLKRIGSKGGRGRTNPDGSALRGRPAVPLQELDRAKKPPSLEACLGGFQTVLQKSCKILCFDLMPTLVPRTDVRSNANANAKAADCAAESDSDESNRDDNINRAGCYNTQEHKREQYRLVSKTVKDLWKAYLWSWKEGADFYSNLYPQIRFALRDLFLPPTQRAILYQTLAASAEEKLTRQVHRELDEEDDSKGNNDSDSDSDSDINRDSDSEDDSYASRNNKRIKVEDNPSRDRNVKTEMDSLVDLFHRSDGGKISDKIKSENVVSDEDIPIPDIVLSNEQPNASRHSNMPLPPFHSRVRRPWDRGNTYGDNNISNSSTTFKSEQEGSNSGSNRDNNDIDDDDNDNGDNYTVTSELSNVDRAENETSAISARKRKRTKLKEAKHAYTTNPFAKMIYYHNKIINQKTKSRKIPQLGRKEAALLLRPSMELVLGILLVAASPHGVTEGKLVEWVGNGSLPILQAFECLLSGAHQEKLAMLALFFSPPKAPDPSNLKFLTRKIHVACGYRPPTVKLVSRPSPLQQQRRRKRRTQERILTAHHLSVAGRLVRPSSVPMILGFLVSELGLSQRVLNYSLALMGLPVSRSALKAKLVSESNVRGRPRLWGTQADKSEQWDSDGSPVFDLNNPSEVLRRKKYLNKLAQRRRRAKRRRKLGLPVYTLYRNKKYHDIEHKNLDAVDNNDDGVDDGVPNVVPSGLNERLDVDDSPDLVTGRSRERLRQAKHRESKAFLDESDLSPKNENTDWLPPPLLQARPDKLGEIDQILAVVVVACKLIPDWERNHHYVFSRGHGRGAAESKNSIAETTNGNIAEEGTLGLDEFGGESSDDAGLFKPKDRFVPWNHEEFRRIGNGKMELEYLKFLKECIFRGKRYALPKFVESLSKTSSPPSDDHGASEEDPFKEEEEDTLRINSDVDMEVNSPNNDNTVVVPNDIVLGWKRNPRFEEAPPTPKKDRLGRVPYRPTTRSDMMGLRKPGGPLGPLIEYMAYKAGTCPNRILDQLMKLDEEMCSKGKPEKPTLVLPPDVCYNHFIGGADVLPLSAPYAKTPPQQNRKRTTEQRQSSTPTATPTKTNTSHNAESNIENNWEFFLAQSLPQRNEELGDRTDNILTTQRSPETDDLSVTSAYAV